MTKIMGTVALVIGLALLAPSWEAQDNWRQACIQQCYAAPAPGDPELQRQEIVSLEKEAAHAIQLKRRHLLSGGAYTAMIYRHAFSRSAGRQDAVDRSDRISAVKYESFNASDIRVRVFQETAVATCLWSARSIFKGQHISSQIRAVHVYVDTPRGWHVVSAQSTVLPPGRAAAAVAICRFQACASR